jgi:putative transposase
VLKHSDQSVPYTCSDWRKFLADHNLEASMTRRGTCHDKAVGESFFSITKTERIKRRIFKTRNETRTDIFSHVEFLCHPSRRHGNNDGVSQVGFETQCFKKLSNV